MSSGFYAAFSGWLARSEALDSAASNLANAGTQGFRAEREYFRSAHYGSGGAEGDQLDRTVNDFGVLGGNRLDLGQGALTTDRQSAGCGHRRHRASSPFRQRTGIRYTRDGSFQRAARRNCSMTSQGEPVLDAQNNPSGFPRATSPSAPTA